LECATRNIKIEDVNNKLLLATDDIGWTVWQVATKKGNIQILEEILDWAKQQLTTVEIKIKLLLATENREKTAWQLAEKWGNSEALEKLWN
jgi:hypothetical protein